MQNAFERDNTFADEKGNYYYPETIDDSKLIETKIEEQKQDVEKAPKQVDMNEL